MTLDHLAEMAKGRVKIEEFTLNDRINLLDLFVNNDKTLVVVHETLFPKPQKSHRGNHSDLKTLQSDLVGPQTTMMESSSAYDSRTNFNGLFIKSQVGVGRNGKAHFTTMDRSLATMGKGESGLNVSPDHKKDKLPAIATPQAAARSDAYLQNTNNQ